MRLITGPKGHGKTLYASRLIARSLLTGKAVVTNIELMPGWERRILMHSPWYRFANKEEKRLQEIEIRTRYAHVEDFVKMLGAQLKGYGEKRGVRIFDETHNKLSTRDWKDDVQKQMLFRLSAARHRGWDDYVITQHSKNVDVMIRRLAEAEIRVIDWQKLMMIPIFNVPILPFHMFLAQEFPVEETAVPGITKMGRARARELYFLGWWKRIYDTHAEIHFEDELDDSGLWLPFPPELVALPPGLPDEVAKLPSGEVVRQLFPGRS